MNTSMKKCILALTMAASACMAAPAFAQSTMASATTATMTSDSLYRAFGEKPGLVRLMDDFMLRLLADPRTQPHFKSVDQGRVKAQLVDQICMALGGPCVYKGADMRALHSNLDITKSDFHALVEVLQLSMDAQGLAFHTQNKLLALLAPMHRDVITVKN
jgi:hemoglobin